MGLSSTSSEEFTSLMGSEVLSVIFLLSITEKLSYSPLIPHLTILLFISEQLLSESKSMTKRNL